MEDEESGFSSAMTRERKKRISVRLAFL